MAFKRDLYFPFLFFLAVGRSKRKNFPSQTDAFLTQINRRKSEWLLDLTRQRCSLLTLKSFLIAGMHLCPQPRLQSVLALLDFWYSSDHTSQVGKVFKSSYRRQVIVQLSFSRVLGHCNWHPDGIRLWFRCSSWKFLTICEAYFLSVFGPSNQPPDF